jgi:hypothetical protein
MHNVMWNWRRACAIIGLISLWIMLRGASLPRHRWPLLRRARPQRRAAREKAGALPPLREATHSWDASEQHHLDAIGGAGHAVPSARARDDALVAEEFVMFGTKISELGHDSGRLHRVGLDPLAIKARRSRVDAIANTIAHPCAVFPKQDCVLLPRFAWAMRGKFASDAERAAYLVEYAKLPIADRYLFAVGVFARKTWADADAKRARLANELSSNVCILIDKLVDMTPVELDALLQSYAANGPRWLDSRFNMPRDRPPMHLAGCDG